MDDRDMKFFPGQITSLSSPESILFMNLVNISKIHRIIIILNILQNNYKYYHLIYNLSLKI
jgi:hypothetical protein